MACWKPCFDPVFSLSVLQKSFRTGTSTRLDDRVFSMCQLKYQPLAHSMLMIHPSLYRVDDLTDEVRERAADETVYLLLFIFSLLWSPFWNRLHFGLWFVREHWTSTSGPSPSPGCCSSLWRSSAGKELSSWMLEQYDSFRTVIIYSGTHLFSWLTHAFFSFVKGDLFVDWAELQSQLPHTSSGSSQLCCCAWEPGRKATIMHPVSNSFWSPSHLFVPAPHCLKQPSTVICKDCIE